MRSGSAVPVTIWSGVAALLGTTRFVVVFGSFQLVAGFTTALIVQLQHNSIPPVIEPIGAGSLSFEIVRALVERVPVMIIPKWVSIPTQPIAVDDVLAYLSATLDQTGDQLLEIMMRTINGRYTAAEALGHREFVLTRLFESA